jgi:hypothetical protein
MQTFVLDASQLTTEVPFYKAQATVPNGNCVELARLEGGGVAVRHSKNPTGPALVYTPAEMDAFFDGVRKGEFDGLLA